MIIVLDCETTGIDASKDAVVEVAAVGISRKLQHPDGVSTNVWRVSEGYSSLVAPGRRVPPAARAVHHLGDGELRNAPKLAGALNVCLLGAAVNALDLVGSRSNGIEYIAAHNADFDRAFMGDVVKYILGRDVPWLCTWRCALHLYPDAETHSNQGLRYALRGLDDAMRAALPVNVPPHRALYDATTTAFLLQRMLSQHSIGDLLALQDKPVLQRVCRFGKHRGTPWSDVPLDYCRWLLRAEPPFDRDVQHTARHYLGQVT
jgi:exodeoxyribonuclease X